MLSISKAGLLLFTIWFISDSYAVTDCTGDADSGTCSSNSELDFTSDWDLSFDPALDSDICNLPKLVNPSAADFQRYVDIALPVILVDVAGNDVFIKACERPNLLREYGNNDVILSSANAYSYDKLTAKLSKYIFENMNPQTLEADADKTWYQFGDNYLEGWTEFLEQYNRPPYLNSDEIGSISFGMAGSGTGVPLHRHGAVFAEVIHGKKRWFLYPASQQTVQFHPNQTSYNWLVNTYAKMTDSEKPQECVLKRGEVLYIPSNWWHATLNLGQSVFISVFV